MTSNHTPTTRQVRACYTVGVDDDSAEGREFDRWLTRVKAEAWFEGRQAQLAAQDITLPRGVTIPLAVNPYRVAGK